MGESIEDRIAAGHTPGPWMYGQNWHQIGRGQFEIGLSQSEEAGGGISGCRNGSDEYMLVSGPCREADARLMAAAPELLEALRALDRVLNKPGVPMHSDAVQAAIESARAAIARAEGRA